MKNPFKLFFTCAILFCPITASSSVVTLSDNLFLLEAKTQDTSTRAFSVSSRSQIILQKVLQAPSDSKLERELSFKSQQMAAKITIGTRVNPTRIPEPGVLLLFAIGLTGLILSRQKLKN